MLTFQNSEPTFPMLLCTHPVCYFCIHAVHRQVKLKLKKHLLCMAVILLRLYNEEHVHYSFGLSDKYIVHGLTAQYEDPNKLWLTLRSHKINVQTLSSVI